MDPQRRPSIFPGKPPSILNVDMLASEFAITKSAAQKLMQRDDFPATETAPGHFVIMRKLLEAWTENNCRTHPVWDVVSDKEGVISMPEA